MQAEEVDQRLTNLNEYFMYSLYLNICRSLFESHKLMFSLLLVTAIMKNQNRIDAFEWRFLLAGPTNTSLAKPNPAAAWCTDKASLHASCCANGSRFRWIFFAKFFHGETK